MKRQGIFSLLLKLIILGILVAGFIMQMIPAYEQGYTAALIDKVETLKNINEPKIVLIGNSNLAFGIDSKKIEKELGMPVINMGLHGGLSNAFHEEMAKININAGDIYVICHTDYSDNDTLEDGVLIWTTLENKWELWHLLRKQDISIMTDTFSAYLKKCIKRWSEGTSNEIPEDEYYRRSSFNSHGDIGKKRRNSKLGTLGIEASEYCPKISDICTERLNKLNNFITSNGAYMVVAGYPIIIDDHPSNTFIEELNAFQNQLNELLECPVISNYTDYCYDESYFFDTIYHLTDGGVKLRTEQLIEDLKIFLAQ